MVAVRSARTASELSRCTNSSSSIPRQSTHSNNRALEQNERARTSLSHLSIHKNCTTSSCVWYKVFAYSLREISFFLGWGRGGLCLTVVVVNLAGPVKVCVVG
ncbi:unnamed protein product, partial [Ectocarpus sp. 12 AP-2014]